MQRFLDELDISEEQLIGKEYKINILKVFGDIIIGYIKVQEIDYNFEYNYSSKILTINEEEKDIQWLKNIIKCYSLDWIGKITLINKGLYHDILINDKNWEVHKAIAKITTNEKYLNKLITDKDWSIRRIIAERGLYHDIFINDESYEVRAVVAENTENQEYLEILARDKCKRVRLAVVNKINNKKYLDKFLKCKDKDIHNVLARRGLYHDILINHNYWGVRFNIACITTNEDYLKRLAVDKDWFVREKIAHRGFCHDILVNDEDWHVRSIIAKTTTNEKCLEILAKDIDKDVRKTALERLAEFK